MHYSIYIFDIIPVCKKTADQQMINSLSTTNMKSVHSRTGDCDRIAASTLSTS